MIDIILLFFAVTFIYTGILTAPQNGEAALGTALIGAVLSVRPLVRLFRYLRPTYFPKTGSRHSKSHQRGRGNIKIVKSDEKRPPTYH
jgi:hypothetical protein